VQVQFGSKNIDYRWLLQAIEIFQENNTQIFLIIIIGLMAILLKLSHRIALE